MTELDIYRQALRQLKETKEVDSGNVFIFGHSMGGGFGPMIAAESRVKGLVVYGVEARTWFEYLLDTIRSRACWPAIPLKRRMTLYVRVHNF